MNLISDTDTYKAGHFLLYPPGINHNYNYYSFRKPFDANDNRMVFFGMRWLIEEYFSKPVTQENFDELDYYLAGHNVGDTQYPWPKEDWQRIIDDGGMLPMAIHSLPDGQTVLPNIPCFVVIADYAWLPGWVEGMMTRIWSASSLATNSRFIKDDITKFFDESVDEQLYWLLDSRLHDFGLRATSSREQPIWSGMGHLLSFDGTDTIPAGIQATKWNERRRIGHSILATEHSVMCSWISYSQEIDAVRNLIRKTPENGIAACVGDTVSYYSFINNILPAVRDDVLAKNITLVVRPDSGNPVECVEDGLKALIKAEYPRHINTKGYLQINNGAIIQGDGIKRPMVSTILRTVLDAGFAASNVAFGMGGGMYNFNRDTMAAATKLSDFWILDREYTAQKKPTGDKGKFSLPGKFHVGLVNGNPRVSELTFDNATSNLLKPVYYYGHIGEFETFQQMRERLATSWTACTPHANGVSDELMEKVNSFGEKS